MRRAQHGWWIVIGIGVLVVGSARAADPAAAAAPVTAPAAAPAAAPATAPATAGAPVTAPATAPATASSHSKIKKRKVRVEQDAEGTEALGRFKADTVIKSQYKLNGEQLEVDPD